MQLFIPLTEQVTDLLLSNLSSRILENWEDVAYQLEFKNYGVKGVKDKKANKTEREKAFEMLIQWKQSNGKGKGATKPILAAALTKASLSKLADFVLKFGSEER